MKHLSEDILQEIITFLTEKEYIRFIQINKYLYQIPRDKELKDKYNLLQILPVVDKYKFKHVYYDLNNWDEKLIPETVNTITFNPLFCDTIAITRKFNIIPSIFSHINLLSTHLLINKLSTICKVISNVNIFVSLSAKRPSTYRKKSLLYNIMNKTKYIMREYLSLRKCVSVLHGRVETLIKHIRENTLDIEDIIMTIKYHILLYFPLWGSTFEYFEIFQKYEIIYEEGLLTPENFDKNLVLEFLEICKIINSNNIEAFEEIGKLLDL